MILYRTSNVKTRKSLEFLTHEAEQTALLRKLQVKQWVDEIFTRNLPIPERFQTRFGPIGYHRNPFYASDNKETTFYEFSYGLLKRKSFIGKAIRASCFEVIFTSSKKTVQVIGQKDEKKILDPTDYLAAQNWLKKLSPSPESVQYPSVRDPNSDRYNFVLYNRSSIKETKTEIDQISLTPLKNNRVKYENLIDGYQALLSPRI